MEVWEFVKNQDTVVDVPEFMKVFDKTLKPYLEVLDSILEDEASDDEKA